MRIIRQYSIIILFFTVLILGVTSLSVNYAAAEAQNFLRIKDGKITFNTISTKATTSTRYKTVGFTITKEKRCTSEESNAACRPQQGKFGVVSNKQVAEEPRGDDKVQTFFEVDAQTVLNALKEADSLDIKNGDELYLSAIFHVFHGSSEDPTDYTDLRSIRSAESWADPNGFRQYYDIRVKWDGAADPVDFILKTVDGTQLAADAITDDEHPGGLWKTGETVSHTLPPTFDYQGVTYTLNKSYIQSTMDESKTKFIQEGDPDSNPQLTKRNFTTFAGGTHLIGVYAEGNPVKAKFFSSDGAELQDPVDLGTKKTGEAASYTFPETIDVEGTTFTIIKSYIAYNADPDNQRFVQEKGSSSLLARNITTPAGGAAIIGVYESDEAPPQMGVCKWTIEPPSVASTKEKTFMNSVASGHILADDLSNDRHFDATKGIPTSENLYANAWDYSYLFNHTFDQMQGNIKYECEMNVRYNLRWYEKRKGKPDKVRTASETKNYNFGFTLPYAYWQINRLEVLQISGATMQNYALPGGSVILTPMQTPPSTELAHDTDVKYHVKPANTAKFSYSPPTVQGGSSRPSVPNDKGKLTSMAQSHTDDPDVRNDKFTFTFSGKKTEVMNGDWIKNEGKEPSEIPDAPLIRSFKETKEMTLYKANLTIPKTLVNKANTPSTGTIYFKLQANQVNGVMDMRYPINNINSVTVHTPVVNYSEITDDQAHNQKTEPNTQRAALILERPFTVRIPTEGQHLNGSSYPGYGDRDYAKYFRTKQVRFPFDVYNEDRTKFIAKDTWIDIPVKQLDTTFQLPVWVDEGDYTVYYRNIAENAPTNFTTQQDANTQLANHVATDTIDVEVIGRLYDFHLTDIADYNWETVFRTQKGSRQPTGLSYWVGKNGIDGQPRGNEQPFTLPIHAGSHPQQGFKNAAIKLGYHFKFDLKTKGNMFSKLDGIRITTDFRYYKKDGSATVPVDLYYRDAKQTFVKIGSAQDHEKRYTLLNERLRNVPEEEMLDTADWKYKTYYTPEQLAGVTQEKFETNYINNVTQQKTSVGNFAQLLLPEQLRTLIGPKTGIPTNASATVERANASIQTWYGEYSLPAETYMVERGTDIAEYARKHGGLDEKSPIWLRQGYVVVNFNIESIQQGDLKHPHLQYIHAPQMNAKKRNQWQMEGFQDQMIDAYDHAFSLQDGDVAFYHAGQSSKDDFGAQAPH